MIANIKQSCQPIQSKISKYGEERQRQRRFSLIPEGEEYEFNDHSFSKVEADSQGSNSIQGIDDIGYETEKEEDESPLDVQYTHAMDQHLAKTKTVNYGNPFNSQISMQRNRAGLFSDDSEKDDGLFNGGNRSHRYNPFSNHKHKDFRSRRQQTK